MLGVAVVFSRARGAASCCIDALLPAACHISAWDACHSALLATARPRCCLCSCACCVGAASLRETYLPVLLCPRVVMCARLNVVGCATLHHAPFDPPAHLIGDTPAHLLTHTMTRLCTPHPHHTSGPAASLPLLRVRGHVCVCCCHTRSVRVCEPHPSTCDALVHAGAAVVPGSPSTS